MGYIIIMTNLDIYPNGVPFLKMHGLGNDFVIIDNRQKITQLSKEQIIKICDRNFIGCDQLILIEKNSSSHASLKALMSIYSYLTYLLTF